MGLELHANVTVGSEPALCGFADDEGADGEQACYADKNNGVVYQKPYCNDYDYAEFGQNHQAADHERIRKSEGPSIDFGEDAAGVGAAHALE